MDLKRYPLSAGNTDSRRVFRTSRTGNTSCGWLHDLITLYKAPEAVCLWLASPHPLLNGCRPIDVVIASAGGEKRVAAIVDQLASGAYL